MTNDILEFWQQVKKEYLQELDFESGDYYICNNSETFRKVYNLHQDYLFLSEYRKEIIKFAKLFLTIKKIEVDAEFVGLSSLFPYPLTYDPYRIRVEFIEFCIKQAKGG